MSAESAGERHRGSPEARGEHIGSSGGGDGLIYLTKEEERFLVNLVGRGNPRPIGEYREILLSLAGKLPGRFFDVTDTQHGRICLNWARLKSEFNSPDSVFRSIEPS